MRNGVLNKPFWEGEFFLIRFFRAEYPVFKFFRFIYIEGNAKLAKYLCRKLAKTEKKQCDETGISDQ